MSTCKTTPCAGLLGSVTGLLALEVLQPQAAPWRVRIDTDHGECSREGLQLSWRIEPCEIDGCVARCVASVRPKAEGDSTTPNSAEDRQRDRIEVALRVIREITDDANPWFLIPGAFYGENRPSSCTRIFPRYDAYMDDPAQMVSPTWEIRADRAASPLVIAWGSQASIGLLTAIDSDRALPSLGFRRRADLSSTAVYVTVPMREEPVRYYGEATPLPPVTCYQPLDHGEQLDLEVDLCELGSNRHGYARVLRYLFGQHTDQRATPWVGLEEAADLAAHGLFTWHYDADPGVLLETVGFDRGMGGQDGKPVDRQAMHVAWISGIPWAYAMLRHARRVADADLEEAACRVISFICSALAPSGTFYGVWYREHGWRQSWTELHNGVHARTLGEAILFLQRALHEFPDLAAKHPTWSRAVDSHLQVILSRQRPDGNLGAIHDLDTGEVLSWHGAAGLIWVAVLAESKQWDSDPVIRHAGHKAADYYAQFVHSEFLHGAPEDVDLAPTSEDGYNAIIAYVCLYRRTGEKRWLELARYAAEWVSTFRYSYNVPFPAGTMLERYGFRTRGGDQASASNQHLHSYGLICTAEMRELAAMTDDHFLIDIQDEHLACFRQMVARFDGDMNAYRGMVSERYYHTDCFQPQGMLLGLSHAWCVGVLLLAAEDLIAPARRTGMSTHHSLPA